RQNGHRQAFGLRQRGSMQHSGPPTTSARDEALGRQTIKSRTRREDTDSKCLRKLALARKISAAHPEPIEDFRPELVIDLMVKGNVRVEQFRIHSLYVRFCS